VLADAGGAAQRPQPSLSRDGRDHEFATSAPGQNSMKPNTCAALAETLKLNGYSTAQIGKCHEVQLPPTITII